MRSLAYLERKKNTKIRFGIDKFELEKKRKKKKSWKTK